MGDICVYFLSIYIFWVLILLVLNPSPVNPVSFPTKWFPTKVIKLVWNKLGCLLYPQSFHYLQFMFSVTLSKIYSCI